MDSTTQTLRPITTTELVGHIGTCVSHLIPAHCGVLAVHITPGVADHYRKKHGKEMDVAYAERMLPSLLADPVSIYQGKKQSTLVFVGQYSRNYLLIVPVKCGQAHIWQETMYKSETSSFLQRGWVRTGLLYAR